MRNKLQARIKELIGKDVEPNLEHLLLALKEDYVGIDLSYMGSKVKISYYDNKNDYIYEYYNLGKGVARQSDSVISFLWKLLK